MNNQQETINILKNTLTQLQSVVDTIEKDSTTNLPDFTTLNQLVTTTEELTKSLGLQDSNQKEVNHLFQTKDKDNLGKKFQELGKDLSSLKRPNKSQNIKKKERKARKNSNVLWLVLGIVLSLVFIGYFVLFNHLIVRGEQPIKTEEKTEITKKIKIEETTPLKVQEELELSKEIIDPPNQKENWEIENNTSYEIKLNSEQQLEEIIKNIVKKVTDKYEENLVVDFKTNLSKNFLVINLSNNWYNLAENQQKKLAETIFKKVKKLDFNHLKIIDNQGNLLARSAIVGDKMIILKSE